MACAIRTGPEMFLFKIKQKIKSSNYFSAMPDIEMNPLFFKAFSHPTTSHEETSFQRIQPYASFRKAKPPVPPRLGTDPVMLRLSEPRFRHLDDNFELALKSFFLSQKKPALNFLLNFAFCNKILT